MHVYLVLQLNAFVCFTFGNFAKATKHSCVAKLSNVENAQSGTQIHI